MKSVSRVLSDVEWLAITHTTLVDVNLSTSMAVPLLGYFMQILRYPRRRVKLKIDLETTTGEWQGSEQYFGNFHELWSNVLGSF